jgi:hypothetical protein
MIIGGFAIGVRILLEKDRQDTIFRKIRKIPEKYQEILFYQKTPEARRRRREELGVWPRRPCVRPPWPTSGLASSRTSSSSKT